MPIPHHAIILPGLLSTAVLCAVSATDLCLAFPLTTRIPAEGPANASGLLQATIVVPADAPADLGIGVYVADRHGRWWSHPLPERMTPGRHDIVCDLGQSTFQAEPAGAGWDAAAAAAVTRAGLYAWSAASARCTLTLDGPTIRAATPPSNPPTAPTLRDLVAPRCATTGERWTLTCRPDPLPANPDDPALFTLDALITEPDGTHRRIPGFWDEPMARSDRGDHEDLTRTGAGAFAIRFRPRLPGPHQIRVEARWEGHPAITSAPLIVDVKGRPWDGYVRTDRQDPRFFSRDGAFVWPIGVNLHSMPDSRSVAYLHTRPTPARGTLAYDVLLDRFAANGVTAAEIWMSAWNFALEWRSDHAPYQGCGRFSSERAWQLDHLLDRAAANGVGIKLVLDNHGKATRKVDGEWDDNPWSATRGGPLQDPAQWFTDPRALAGQAALRRYLVARYADHPALLTWKIWSEVNLTQGDKGDLITWHEQAANHLHTLDTYRHPVTTHWSQDYRAFDRRLAALPGLDVITLDAYHDSDRSLSELITGGTVDAGRTRSLAYLRKPIWISEYGAQWHAGDPDQLSAEHASGAWLAWVCGYAGSPMLWWWEWIDQENRFAPYRAIRAFTAGEDLRGPNAGSSALIATSPDGALWSRAWVCPGRVLGYILDANWSQSGGDAPRHDHARVVVGTAVAAGAMNLVWYDADTGTPLPRTTLSHPGGELVLTPPSFRRHCAFKLWRNASPP